MGHNGRVIIAALILPALLWGCPAEPLSLRVDLRTDLEPGVEFSQVRLSLRHEADAAEATLEEENLPVSSDAEFFPAGQLWTKSLARAGLYTLTLDLVDQTGRSVGSRQIFVRITSATGVTAAIFRSCAGVRCAENEECCNGSCVPRPDEGDACATVDPMGMPPGSTCVADADCPSSSTCSTSQCVDGVCFDLVTPGACGVGETCVPSLGSCQPDDCVENWGNDCDDLAVGGGFPKRPVMNPDGSYREMDIEGGEGHSCAVLQGRLYCWGDNRAHVLGPDESRPESHQPVRIGAASNWRRVTAGNEHACAINADGELYCWGHNEWGQLGLGDTEERFEPSLVEGGPWVDVDSGYYHTCAIQRGGALYCWGINASHQAVPGEGADMRILSPTLVERTAVYLSVACGQSHTCAVKEDGRVRCVGRNDHGQLGNTTGTNNPETGEVGFRRTYRGAWFPGRAVSVSAGATTSCVLTEDGRVHCWGQNDFGGLGVMGTGDDVLEPTEVAYAGRVSQMDVGVFHSCVTGAEAACVGRNVEGQLGVGNTDDRATHTPVQLMDVGGAFHQIAVARFHTCGRLPPRTGSLVDRVYCWGKNNAGGIGQPPRDREDSPEDVSFP